MTAQATQATASNNLLVVTSTTGDWIQVVRDGQVLEEGHSLHIPTLLKSLGFNVQTEERHPDDF